VHPIKTGISLIDRAGLMEIVWYELQLSRIANGRDPQPNQGALGALLKALVKNGWGTFKTRRARTSPGLSPARLAVVGGNEGKL